MQTNQKQSTITPGESWLRLNSSGLKVGERSTCKILKVIQVFVNNMSLSTSTQVTRNSTCPTGFILMLGCLNLPLFHSQWEEALIWSAQMQTFWNRSTHLHKYWWYKNFFKCYSHWLIVSDYGIIFCPYYSTFYVCCCVNFDAMCSWVTQAPLQCS